MAASAFYDLSKFDFDRPLFSLNVIRRINPQRFEMEQLTGIVHVDNESHGIVGFKDVTEKEFWIRGHMPDFALMPGVLICECAAQLAGFYASKYNLLEGDYLGFGGMEGVRFRYPVYPSSRLILLARLVSLKQGRRAEFEFQGFVADRLVASGVVIGVPINSNTRQKAKPELAVSPL